MGCCQSEILIPGNNNSKIVAYDYSNPSEEKNIEILSKLKIRQLQKTDLEKLFDKIMKWKFEKIHFEEIFTEYFVDENEKENPYSKIHSKIIYYLIGEIQDYSNKNYIILKIFPFLKKKDDEKYRDFMDLLRNQYGETISWKNLFTIYRAYFEFCTFKVNNIIIEATTNEDLIFHSYDMINECFNHNNISIALDYLHQEFSKYEIKDEKDTADINNLRCFLKNNDILCFDKIRNFLIEASWLRS
jgi:hypothetical protein